MKILFVHQNFPGQFKFLAPALVKAGHEVVATSMHVKKEPLWQGVRMVHYTHERRSSSDIHPWLSDFESKLIRAEACFKKALELKNDGFTPDLIIAHHA